jgi:hypothetical protein
VCGTDDHLPSQCCRRSDALYVRRVYKLPVKCGQAHDFTSMRVPASSTAVDLPRSNPVLARCCVGFTEPRSSIDRTGRAACKPGGAESTAMSPRESSKSLSRFQATR